jgi:RNA polymerase sigma-70 factor (ECF subfamily)
MRLSKQSDQELVKMYLEGSEPAFETLLTRHKDKIFTKVYLMVRDHDLAQDIFQDTFIKVIQTLKSGRYNEEGKFLPWVMRIAHNLTIDHFRRSSKMPAVRSDDRFDVFSTIKQEAMHVEDQIVHDQIRSDVKKLITYLPDEQKEVVIMRLYYKMSFKEISESCDISINTALGRMRYALINLRKIIEEKKIILTTS